jgi:tRNA threonylcarbamoyladenosine biosynthesis protein TsaB
LSRKILALESSAKAASAAVSEDGRLLAQVLQNSALTHSRTLLSMAEGLLADTGLTLAELDGFAVSRGPGSFTGIRIGIAAAKGLAWGAEKPVCGVSTLEAMAWHLADRENAVLCPVMDARRAQVYNALFRSVDGVPERLCADRAISAEELAEEAKKSGMPYFLVGDGALLCYNILRKAGADVRLAPEPLLMQSAWGVLKAAEHAEFVSPDALEPVYLRMSQAEREHGPRAAEAASRS